MPEGAPQAASGELSATFLPSYRQKPVAEEVIGPIEEASSIVFLDGCDMPVKLPSECVFMPTDHCHCQPQFITTAEAPENK